MRRGGMSKGITIVEVVVGVAIISLIVAFISYTLTLFVQSSEEALERSQALYLAEEGQEILRYIRDSDWNTFPDELSLGTTYYLFVSPTTLATSTTPEVIDSTFTRSFVLSEVERDGDGDIVDSGGTVDDETLRVTFTVSWGGDSVSLDTILTNIFNL